MFPVVGDAARHGRQCCRLGPDEPGGGGRAIAAAAQRAAFRPGAMPRRKRSRKPAADGVAVGFASAGSGSAGVTWGLARAGVWLVAAGGEATTVGDLGGALAAAGAGANARAAFGSGLSTCTAGEISIAAGSALRSTFGKAATAGSGGRGAVVGCVIFAAEAGGAAETAEAAAGAGTGSVGGVRRRSLTRGSVTRAGSRISAGAPINSRARI